MDKRKRKLKSLQKGAKKRAIPMHGGDASHRTIVKGDLQHALLWRSPFQSSFFKYHFRMRESVKETNV
ncbi:13308_t:CDS:2 [Dentiscutata erythropus]|uniref:13308_t:CDS:1 n=1 Tax=Dentiscutata erythropus TaxID=1348616 RepID=A0A9N9G0L1_9GLOM|nr:13308_t:CDS:2 [Dentiscutata erythropus]